MNEEINDALRKYAERVQSFKEQFQKWNEDEVKGYLTEPLLAVLLWDTTDPNFVRRQYPVTMGSEIKRVDYALMSGDTPICVVEAKPGELDEAGETKREYYQSNRAGILGYKKQYRIRLPEKMKLPERKAYCRQKARERLATVA